jgi:hypothetical protein
VEIINFKGEGTIVAGVAGKSITVRRLGLAAHAPLKVTIVGTKLAPLVVPVKVQDFASMCPFTLPPGLGLVLRADKADVKVGGYADVDQA